ncbi:bile acid:sodium symporter family protein [Pseudochelatococcus sp. B33]
MELLRRLRLDPYLVLLLATIGLAAFAPVRGGSAVAFGYVVEAAIALLFFLYGAKLSSRAVVEGLTHWRLQGLVFAATYVLFPVLGLAVAFLARGVVSPDLLTGLIFLSVLPSTVQSSIAFTSIARGNVAAALTSASLSNMSGVFVTPALVALLLGGNGGGIDAASIVDIAMQILLPFILGQFSRPLIGQWLSKHAAVTSRVDRGVIILVVYAAFSEGMVEGIWSRVELYDLFWVGVVCAVLLALVLTLTALAGRLQGFNREDRIAILFCGSKKSLATGIPMAGILFAGQSVALIVLPLMIFHQLQLFACAVIAQRYAAELPRAEMQVTV